MKSIHGLTVAVLCILAMKLHAETTSQISQYGITWTFSGQHESGQFANGDYWIVGPVSIIGINPPSAEISGTTSLTGFTPGGTNPLPRTMNGSLLNPVTPSVPGIQGFDSDVYCWHPTAGKMYPPKYNASLNVALGVDADHPLVLPPDSSLVSSISHEKGGRPQTKAMAVLTVLAGVPQDHGATVFRPPYSGAAKPLYSTKNLRKDLLPDLPLVASMPDMKSVISEFQRPWIDHFGHVGDGTQYSSPSENMPNYGREYSQAVGRAALMLMLNEETLVSKYGQNKDALLIRFVQLGIDLYYITENKGYWWGLGGLNQGRKWPIIFAGLMLDDERIRTIGSRSENMSYWGFAEDGQTKYISRTEVELTHSSKWAPDKRAKQLIPYDESDIGLAEWCVGGFAPGLRQADINKVFDTPYRDINGMSYPGLVLPALLMGQKAVWNHDALFDYTDRYVSWAPTQKTYTDSEKSIYVYGGAFQRAMWETYRAGAGK
jgi:hypothetical protein